MVDFTYKRFGLVFREVMFAREGGTRFKNEDVCLFHCGSNNTLNENQELKKHSRNTRIDHQYTIVTSLLECEEEQWKRMNKNYRNEVNRARKESITTEHYCGCEAIENTELLSLFESMYNQMFAEKGMRNKLNREFVEAALKANQMTISVAKYENRILVCHAYVNDEENALLLYSTSLLWSDKELAKKVGWANKLLHWDDICFFQEKGYSKYEWGGIKSVNNPTGIDKFKIGFGGDIVQYDNCILSHTLKGALYIKLLKMRDKRNENGCD